MAAQYQQDRKGIEYLERNVETQPIWIDHASHHPGTSAPLSGCSGL